METGSAIVEWFIALTLFGGMVASLEIGFRLGRRARRQRAEDANNLGSIQGAILGLLALLLGFSFAGAAGRFSDRVGIIVQEANAIGTAWLRSDLLPEAQRSEVRALLRRYIAERVNYHDAKGEAARLASITETGALQTRIWTTVAGAAKAAPALANILLPPFNEMIDLHASRVAAGKRHQPFLLLALLLACSIVAVGTVGYGCGGGGKRNPVLTTVLAFLIAAVLWAIIDMDNPRRGLIRAGQQPMLDLQRSIEKDSSTDRSNPA